MAVMILVALLSFIPSILTFLFLRNNRKEDEKLNTVKKHIGSLSYLKSFCYCK